MALGSGTGTSSPLPPLRKSAPEPIGVDPESLSNWMLANCPAVRLLLVKFNCSLPPELDSHSAPFQFQMERMPVHVAVVLPENVRIEVALPKSITLFVVRLSGPEVASNPPVESLPPLKLNAPAEGMTLSDPSNKVPPVMLVVPM